MAFFGFGYKKKLEEVKRLLEAEDYVAAALAADDIPMQKLKSAHELNVLGRAYKKNEEFAQARDIFQRSYELRCSRLILLDIMDCCLEIRDFEDVEIYFNEYHKVSPEDKVTQYIYRYRIEKKKERDSQLLIPILEELKALQYIEEYAYELAKQYHKAGMAQECMDECSDIILWFGFGPTVERAKALLAYYRGEISIEEIRQAGARYQAELERQLAEERKQAINEAFQPYEAELREKAAMEQLPVSETAEEDTEEEETQLYSMVSEEEAEELLSGFGMEAEETEELLSEVSGEAEEEPPVEEEDPEDGLSESFFFQMAERMQEEEEAELRAEAAVTEETELCAETAVTEETELCAETTVTEVTEEEEFELPEIDLSGLGIDFEMTSTEPETNVPEESQSETGIAEKGEPEIIDTELVRLLQEHPKALAENLKNFGRIERICRQVMENLEQVLNDRNNTYFIVAGDAGTGKTALALSMIRLFYELGLVKYDRTAVIDAVQLNQVSIEDYAEELTDCNLLIENAGGMTRESADGLLRFSEGCGGKTCLFLEDNVRDINKLLRAREDINKLFYKRVQIGKYTGEDLMGFVHDYIEKEDYSIDEAAAQVLRNKTEEIVKEYGNEHRLKRTRKMTEVVMARVEKRTSGQLLKMAAEGKMEQGDYLVITMEDVTP